MAEIKPYQYYHKFFLVNSNVVLHTRKPVVSGITTLEYDHVEALGQSLGEIAWHKAGIFKVNN